MAAGGILVQVPDDEAADAKEFLAGHCPTGPPPPAVNDRHPNVSILSLASGIRLETASTETSAAAESQLSSEILWTRSGTIRRRQMVRRAPARRRRPAPQHRIRLPPSCASPTATAFPVTPRGAGHGYVGGCVPVRGGIVLSLARMNRIKEINAADFVAVVQARRDHRRRCRRQSRNRACFIRPTRPAARTTSSAATSPPTPAARAA